MIKVINLEYCEKTAEPIFHLAVPNQNQLVKITATQLERHTELLHFLNKEDLAKLIEVKTNWQLIPALKIISHFEAKKVTEIVFRDNKGQTVNAKLHQVGRNKALIKQLSPEDAYLLGYLVGSEEA